MNLDLPHPLAFSLTITLFNHFNLVRFSLCYLISLSQDLVDGDWLSPSLPLGYLFFLQLLSNFVVVNVASLICSLVSLPFVGRTWREFRRAMVAGHNRKDLGWRNNFWTCGIQTASSLADRHLVCFYCYKITRSPGFFFIMGSLHAVALSNPLGLCLDECAFQIKGFSIYLPKI